LATRYLRAYDGLSETKELNEIYNADFMAFAEVLLIDLCGYKKEEPNPIIHRPRKIGIRPAKRKYGTRPKRVGETIDPEDAAAIAKYDKKIKEDIEKTIDHKRPEWYKKAWRKAMLQVHPDRVGLVCKDDMDKLERLKIGTRLRTNPDSELLVACCNMLELDIDLNIYEQERMIRVALHQMQSEIKTIQQSIPWVWGESIVDNQMRVQIVKTVLRNSNIQPPDDAILIQYIAKNII